MQYSRRTHISLGLIVALFAATQSPTAIAKVRWGNSALRQDADWYASAEVQAAADTLLLYQSTYGAWPKNTDLFKTVSQETLDRIHGGGEANTIDNGATTTPMRFLAKVIQATDDAKYKEAFARGLDYLFQAQYPNGGWPQYYPLRKGYSSHITFNDGAMIAVMELLRDVADAQAPYDFVDDEQRTQADAAVVRGIDCILKLQIEEEAIPTAWCAQYDENTLEPAWRGPMSHRRFPVQRVSASWNFSCPSRIPLQKLLRPSRVPSRGFSPQQSREHVSKASAARTAAGIADS